jgi:hypothetical protein
MKKIFRKLITWGVLGALLTVPFKLYTYNKFLEKHYTFEVSDIINEFFFYGMALLFFTYILIRFWKDKKRLNSINNFYKLISENEKITTPSHLSLIDEKITAINDKEIQYLWNNFYESLIEVDDEKGANIYQTIDSEYFFNLDTLLREKMNYKLLAYIPQGLVGLGLLGTFLGLALGLDGLNLDTQETIQASIKILISGVKTSFYTSLYGMYFSIAFSFIINIYIGNIEEKIIKLKDSINNKFNKNIEEKTILGIKNKVEKLVTSTNDMAESLKNELQTGLGEIKQSNEILISELGETIHSQMGGLSNGLNESFEKNIGESLEKIFSTDFVEKFENIKDELIEVSEKNNMFISEYKNEIKQISYIAGELRDSYEEASQRITTEFTEFNQKMEVSYKNLDTMYNKSLESFERIDVIFQNSKEKMLELERFMIKSENITESLDEFVDSEKEIIELWKSYKESFEKLNTNISNGLNNYEENLRITSNKYETVLKENFNQYREIIENSSNSYKTIIDESANDYTMKIKDGVSRLFNEYDTQLSEIINKFSSIVGSFSERLDDSNKILNSHKEILGANLRQIEELKNTINFTKNNEIL